MENCLPVAHTFNRKSPKLACACEEELKYDAENAQMAKLYREHVLGEKPIEGLVRLDSIAPAKPVKQQEAEPVAGD